jgi:hypothetical protein
MADRVEVLIYVLAGVAVTLLAVIVSILAVME